jgi:hypothetical protein
MFSKSIIRPFHGEASLDTPASLLRFQPSLWQAVALVSVAAGLGSSWRVMNHQVHQVSPLTAALVTMLTTFVGWFAWGFLTYVADRVLFGGHADYRTTLNEFGKAYLLQVLFALTFFSPLGWLWGWIALFYTVAAFGVVGPRYLGMRTWQAIVASTLGMLVWLGCLLVFTLTLTVDGVFMGVGAFLV